MNPSYLLLFGSVLIASFSQILLKMGAAKNYPTFLRQYLNPYVISGYGLTFISLPPGKKTVLPRPHLKCCPP